MQQKIVSGILKSPLSVVQASVCGNMLHEMQVTLVGEGATYCHTLLDEGQVNNYPSS